MRCKRCPLEFEDREELDRHMQFHRLLDEEMKAVFVEEDRTSAERQRDEQNWDQRHAWSWGLRHL